MDDFITIYYWVRLAVLVVVTLLSLATAIRMSGRRTYRSWREVLFGLMTVTFYVVLSVIVGVHYGPVWAAVLAVLGLVAGFFASRGERMTSEGERTRLRRSPLVPWVWFVAIVLATATLLFAEPYLFALSMLLLAFAVGLVVGETIALLMGAKDAAEPTPAPEVSAA